MSPGPLDGVRVLEFSQIVALPFGGAVLSDLGAEVIKVEPLAGDPHRNRGAVMPNEGKRFQSLNRGKQSVAVNLRDPRGLDFIHRVVPTVDVVTINYRPGVSHRLGIDYETLKNLNHGLIYCEITGFGNRGPMGDRGGTDIVANGYSGLMMADQKVDAHGQPANISAISLADYCAGFSATVGICSALYYRSITGKGQKIETSLLQAALAVQDTVVMREPVHDATLRDPMVEEIRKLRERGADYTEIRDAYVRGRGATRVASRAYYTTYQVKDGSMVLGALTPANRAAARKVLGIAHDPSDDPDFDESQRESMEKATALHEEMRSTLRKRTLADWLEAFTAAGVPVAPVNMAEEMADDPQVEAMGFMRELEHPLFGRQRLAGPVVSMSETPTDIRGISPGLGADTESVMREAGFTSEEIEAMRQDGVIL
ncbi:MAG: CoA transferase [Chloroflexi bacterium]|nr:CoA transferase [Chloroflexota bacterium]